MDTILGSIDKEGRCKHYHSPKDVVAIKFSCCNEFYACIACHQELADHPATQWPEEAFDNKVVLCGVCRNTLTVNEYFACNNTCMHCGALFNPGCRNHYPFYFRVP